MCNIIKLIQLYYQGKREWRQWVSWPPRTRERRGETEEYVIGYSGSGILDTEDKGMERIDGGDKGRRISHKAVLTGGEL